MYRIKNNDFHIPKTFARKGVLVYVLLVVTNFLFYPSNFLPIIWLVFGSFTVIFFFYSVYYYSYFHTNVSWSKFIKSIFLNSLIIRLLWIFFSYYFYLLMTGSAFEFGATDVLWFDARAKEIMNDPLHYFTVAPPSNAGYIVYLSYIYNFFGTGLIIPRIIKALISSYTVILIANLAKRNFGQETGKIAGIISVFLPNFIYYTGLHLRETEMVFLVVVFVNSTDKIFRNHSQIWMKYGIPSLSLILLFLVRTVVASVAFLSLVMTIMFANSKFFKLHSKFTFLIIIIIIYFFISSTYIFNEVNEYWDGRKSNQELSFAESTLKEGGNKLLKYASAPLIAPFMLSGPFPTLVYIKNQENTMLLNGVYFTRNIYAFFVFISLLYLYRKRQMSNHILLLSFFVGYFIVLGFSGFILAERFYMPVLPFIIIFAAHGLTLFNKNHLKYFKIYLIVLFFIIVGWNWFKLAGRNLI